MECLSVAMTPGGIIDMVWRIASSEFHQKSNVLHVVLRSTDNAPASIRLDIPYTAALRHRNMAGNFELHATVARMLGSAVLEICPPERKQSTSILDRFMTPRQAGVASI